MINSTCELKKLLLTGNVQPLRCSLILLRTVMEKWRGERGISYTIMWRCLKKLLARLNNVDDWKIRMIWSTNFSNIFLQENFWVTAAKPLQQFYHPEF